MIGATREIIFRAEDREEFRQVVKRAGLEQAISKTVSTMQEANDFLQEIGLPAIIRPAFTLGGTGGGIAYNRDEFADIVRRGLEASRINQVLIDESLLGWKEYELEVVRDKNDNCVVVCGIENIDPMGVHTGDSITVAPILTLTDKEYQRMRDSAIAIMREVGVDTGGSNVQFAVNPKNGKQIVIEMNPRVSRSSALASKATGFPIASIAAKLAIGYTLDELRNDITQTTSACFEPSIDYVVTKMPRWTFEKFPEADETLTTQMKSVGEAMSIGRTFKESFQKAIRSMEVKRFGFGLDKNDEWLRSTLGSQPRTDVLHS
jgi:carbamoyl-phosphate synthase large subunit